MNMPNNQDPHALSVKDAEHIIRMFNVGFNSAMLYGGSHPTTLKNLEPFIAAIIKTLEVIPIMSIIVDRESLFVDEYCTDKAVNPKRIVTQFSKLNIQSVSFEHGVTLACIQEFFKLAGDMNVPHSADEITATFNAHGCKGIRLNHVRYGKITSDDAIVSRDAVERYEQQGIGSGPATLSPNAIEEIQKVISLAKMLERPRETAQTIAESIANNSDSTDAATSIEQIRSEVQSSNPHAVESLLNAVLELKLDLSDAIETQKLTGKILLATDPVLTQMDRLTCDVLAKLIKEEYEKGDISIRRFAQIIRRMLPDITELKRVLPQLKTVLLETGMPLTDYLQLIRSIDIEVESESLATLLSDAASGIGASTEDVVSAIKAHPDDAAKLMFLASEIRQGTDQDEMQLSNMLCEYIEKVGSSIALDSKDIHGPQGNSALGKIITTVENQLVDKLKVYGIDQPVLFKVKQMLEERFQSTCTTTAAQWMANNISFDSEVEMQSLAEKLSAFIGQDQTIQKISEPLIATLQKKGYTRKQIEEFIQKVSRQIETKHKTALPSDILTSNNMLFMLNREIKQHLRYNTPFTTLLISIALIKTHNTAFRKPSPDELRELTPQLFSFVKGSLRDIDLVGSLSSKDAVILALLTMTNQQGALIVLQRLANNIAITNFTLGEALIQIEPVISITIPESTITKDLNSFLDTAKNNHKTALIKKPSDKKL